MARQRPTQRPSARKAPAASRVSAAASFSHLVDARLGSGASAPDISPGESLAALDYGAEIAIKEAALASFWQEARLAASPEALISSPRPRGYRTTSKRRIELLGRVPYLFLAKRRARAGTPRFVPSPLEPAEHADLYRFLLAKLSEPGFRVVAEHLGWLIVRGSYRERAVIFNVDGLSGPLVRKLKILGGHLAAHRPPIVAAFVYVDDTDSDYYLETRRPYRAMSFKNLFGPDRLRVAYGDLRLSFHPTSFCQVNESIVPQMLRLADEMLEPRSSERLIDLYCGYGLFSHALAHRVHEVIGVDAEGPSIEAAQANAQRLRRGRTRFIASRITAEAIEQLPRPVGDEIVLLDPPRNGTERGVIEAIAARHPRRVVHVFCNVDEIPHALGEWAAAGYAPKRIVPIDMFPGTANLEVLAKLEPAGGTGNRPEMEMRYDP
jgi:tRNA/tmRNA/rRNA uracil-C5-methylase (TrmA/RlmC/RlmD family)